MLIEGNLLIGILIVVALVIVAIGVYLRFVARKGQDPEAAEEESFFGRFLKFGSKDEEEAEDAVPAGSATGDGSGSGGLSLPPSRGGAKVAAGEGPEKKAGLGGMFSGLLGARKSKDQIKEEVQAIDAQLNSVLQESEEINVFGSSAPTISATESPAPSPMSSPMSTSLSDGLGMRELDMEMGVLQGPLEIVTPDELKPEPPALDMAPNAPPAAAAPMPSAEPAKTENKPEAPPQPAEAGAPKAAKEITLDDTKGTGDLLDSLEASTKQEELIDMSIMKEYQDMPITCVELEGELKGILDQITINAGGGRNPGA